MKIAKFQPTAALRIVVYQAVCAIQVRNKPWIYVTTILNACLGAASQADAVTSKCAFRNVKKIWIVLADVVHLAIAQVQISVKEERLKMITVMKR